MPVITLDTREAGIDELSAIMAFCAALGGRLPETKIGNIKADVTPTLREAVAAVAAEVVPPPPPPAGEPDTSNVAIFPTPSTQPTPIVSADISVELDADGVPWDERIHASTRTKTGEGRWTKRRKVDEVTYGQVFAELQERYAGEAPTVVPPPPAAAVAPPPPPANAGNVPPPPPANAGNVPPPPPPTDTAAPVNAPTAAPSVPVANASGGGRFADFPAFVTAVGQIRQPMIPYAELNRLVESLSGVGIGFRDMKDRPDLWDSFYEAACFENGKVPE